MGFLSPQVDRRAGSLGTPTPVTIVALSVSRAEDSARFGFHPPDLEVMLLEMAQRLLSAGVRLAYGGHPKPEGHTRRLVELVRARALGPTHEPARSMSSAPELVSYVAWPLSEVPMDDVLLGPGIQVKKCPRPADVDDEWAEGATSRLLADLPVDSGVRRLAWARGLSSMREQQTSDVMARIAVGGRIGTTGGYLGRMPGVLEEILLGLRSGGPVYLVGAFGGVARVAIDALEGLSRRELTWGFHRVVPYSEGLKELYLERGLDWDDYEAIGDELATIGLLGLRNGLSLAENRELAVTRSVSRIAQLILQGLAECYPSPN